jgi:hypothetical protein
MKIDRYSNGQVALRRHKNNKKMDMVILTTSIHKVYKLVITVAEQTVIYLVQQCTQPQFDGTLHRQ